MSKENKLQQFKSLSDLHRVLGFPKPMHPLISLINGVDNPGEMRHPNGTHMLSFYKISFSPNRSGKVKYGQHHYDFDDGGMLFASPNQIIGGDDDPTPNASYFTLLIHPDFFLGYPLAKKIKQYGFFSYLVNEGLHLSEKEKQTILSVFRIIEEELKSRIDEFSQDVVIAQIELLLKYANRFYKRQFITRKAVTNDMLLKLEEVLDSYIDNEKRLREGIPTVEFVAEQLHVSPNYLSDMLRSLIGQNAQQYIHYKLIEKAKVKLSTTVLSVSEIAYGLGFKHPQSFSKWFKTKTNLSPLDFKRSFT